MTTLNRTQLATALGKTVRQVETLMGKGLPVLQYADRAAGIPYQFELEDCEEWLEDYEDQLHTLAEIKRVEDEIANEENEDIVKARIAKLEVETKRLELRLEREQGEVVPIEDITTIVERQYASVKSSLRALPSKLAPSLVNRTEVKEINDIITDYVNEALEELREEEVYEQEGEDK